MVPARSYQLSAGFSRDEGVSQPASDRFV
jgi:hypothetical protein